MQAVLTVWLVLLWQDQESLIKLASVCGEETFEVWAIASCTSKDRLTG